MKEVCSTSQALQVAAESVSNKATDITMTAAKSNVTKLFKRWQRSTKWVHHQRRTERRRNRS
ncbi:hypothetical protein OH492_11175 [Vibrio chagasii]|nr:hypothetical protein [Vibrio chagasii]